MKRSGFRIEDVSQGEPRQQVKGEIISDDHHISIYFDGFGNLEVDESEQSPIFVKLYKGELVCWVQRNKNDKSPVKVVLSGARITKGD
jgi:hypothetical protein